MSRSGSRGGPKELSGALCAWFARAARDLPWRRKRTGWSALVAETMLQQTQVSRVVERFEQFMKRFPTARKLAQAREQEVLTLWQGMGYYRRARNLHAAARMIVKRFGGRVPEDAVLLRELPGVGRYTAGAIASIVFRKREPIVDGNVARVMARLHARRSRSGTNATAEWTWSRATELVQAADEPGVLNEALMELGATVCTPRTPQCDSCPVARFCRAKRLGAQDRIPAPQPRARQRAVHHHAVVIRRNERVLLEKRGDDGLWSNMWQTPTIESARPLRTDDVQRMLVTRVGPTNGAKVTALRRRGRFEHHTTHRRITFHVFEAQARGGTVGGRWRRHDDVDDLPLSAPQRRILNETAVEKKRSAKPQTALR